MSGKGTEDGLVRRIINAVEAVNRGEVAKMDVKGGCIVKTAWVGSIGNRMIRIDLVMKEKR